MVQLKKSAIHKKYVFHKKNSYIIKIKTYSPLLVMCLPAMLLMFFLNYLPMFGLILAFKDFKVNLGMLGSPWVGFDNFVFFFTSDAALRVTMNTVLQNSIFITINTCLALILAIMMTFVGRRGALKVYQTSVFLPYFVSWVVGGYMLFAFLNDRLGIINTAFGILGWEQMKWYSEPKYWPFILTIMYVWKNIGYSTLIYFSGLMGIDTSYYEAAAIDGASVLKMVFKITLPLLSPIITVMVILAIGKIFYADFGLFYHLPRNIGLLYPTTDVIDTYVFRALKLNGDTGMSAAVGLYQSVVGFIMVLLTNYIVKRINSDNAIF